MCIDNECAVPVRATHEIVSGIADDQSDTFVSRKVDTGLNMVLRLRHDDVLGVVPVCAASRCVGHNQWAGFIREVWPEAGDGLIRTVKPG
jgi:hypothetical protein